jgi:hypothetical protein
VRLQRGSSHCSDKLAEYPYIPWNTPFNFIKYRMKMGAPLPCFWFYWLFWFMYDVVQP